MRTNTKVKIVDYITEHGQARVKDLSESLNIYNTAIHRHLNQLIASGQIVRVGKPPLVYYMKQEENTRLPDSFRLYFWDVNFEQLRIRTHAHLIIKRVLDRGNLSDIRWLIKTYGMEEIKKVVMGTKDLSRPTGNFWADLLKIDKTKVPCLQKPYFPIHFGLSS